MVWRPPRSTRTDHLFPYPTLVRSLRQAVERIPDGRIQGRRRGRRRGRQLLRLELALGLDARAHELEVGPMLVGHLERRTADDLRRLDRLLDHARPAVIPCARVLRTTGATDLVIVRPPQVAAGFAAEPARKVEDVACAAKPTDARIAPAADDDADVLDAPGLTGKT